MKGIFMSETRKIHGDVHTFTANMYVVELISHFQMVPPNIVA
jgi:hypothetical protein